MRSIISVVLKLFNRRPYMRTKNLEQNAQNTKIYTLVMNGGRFWVKNLKCY